MELSEERIVVGAPRQTVVDEMQRPEVLERTIPTCTGVERIDEHEYEASVSERISMMSLDMLLDIDVVEFNPPDDFAVTISGHGEGSDTRVSADAQFDLSETEDGQTAIDFTMDIDVSGKLASLGFRMLRSTVEQRTDEMIENIETEFGGDDGDAETEAGTELESESAG
jgi:carbon monoxide dehydrogenase subunit G